MERGDWDAARALLLPLGSFENAAALEQDCRFRQAEEAAVVITLYYSKERGRPSTKIRFPLIFPSKNRLLPKSF